MLVGNLSLPGDSDLPDPCGATGVRSGLFACSRTHIFDHNSLSYRSVSLTLVITDYVSPIAPGDVWMHETRFQSSHEPPQTRSHFRRRGLREVLVLKLYSPCHRMRDLVRPGSDAERVSTLFQRFPWLYTAFRLIRSAAPSERASPFIGLHLKG